ncbi:MAG: copper oxidase [Planctomycetaceae bacterium]|nr:copper oxidase [Planctomycetaceae bacterium]
MDDRNQQVTPNPRAPREPPPEHLRFTPFAPLDQVAPAGPPPRPGEPFVVPGDITEIPPGKHTLAREFEAFDRTKPTYGGLEDGDTYLGKLVAGLRAANQPPVEITSLDIPKLSFRMIDGFKEFHLVAEPVQRELYPGQFVDTYGYNKTTPGPLIEATQGDRIRIILTNNLREPTTLHLHNIQVPVEYDGTPGLTVTPLAPGKTLTMEFRLHQAGTFAYHSKLPLQQGSGMIGMFVVHPRKAWLPTVDRDFALLLQNFSILPGTTVNDVNSQHDGETVTGFGWNWQAINGRTGPFTTPLVCQHGERIRLRMMNFSPNQGHAVHVHGHVYWITGHEAGREPKSEWYARTTEIVLPGQGADLEFVANNPGDWGIHCNMALHMTNHLVPPIGPRIRDRDGTTSRARLDQAPPGESTPSEDNAGQPLAPTGNYRVNWTADQITRLNAKRELRGMHPDWLLGPTGLYTILRVLPPDLFDLVMNKDVAVAPGQVFDEIVRRANRASTQ